MLALASSYGLNTKQISKCMRFGHVFSIKFISVILV